MAINIIFTIHFGTLHSSRIKLYNRRSNSCYASHSKRTMHSNFAYKLFFGLIASMTAYCMFNPAIVHYKLLVIWALWLILRAHAHQKKFSSSCMKAKLANQLFANISFKFLFCTPSSRYNFFK